jgi:hypothetical protein
MSNETRQADLETFFSTMDLSNESAKNTAIHDLIVFVSGKLGVTDPFSLHYIPYKRIESLSPFYSRNIQYLINLDIVDAAQAKASKNKDWCKYVTKQIFLQIASELYPEPLKVREPGYMLVNCVNEYMKMRGLGETIFDLLY